MNIEEEQRRGGAARQWLEDPMFKEARARVYDLLRANRQRAPHTDTLLHSKLILMEQVADQFFGFFELLAQTGKLADAHLLELEKRRQTFGERLQAYARFGRQGI